MRCIDKKEKDTVRIKIEDTEIHGEHEAIRSERIERNS
jgi:hypothetical protein